MARNMSKSMITAFGRSRMDNRNQLEAVACVALASPVACPAKWLKNQYKKSAGKDWQWD